MEEALWAETSEVRGAAVLGCWLCDSSLQLLLLLAFLDAAECNALDIGSEILMMVISSRVEVSREPRTWSTSVARWRRAVASEDPDLGVVALVVLALGVIVLGVVVRGVMALGVVPCGIGACDVAATAPASGGGVRRRPIIFMLILFLLPHCFLPSVSLLFSSDGIAGCSGVG